jgi:uncharacterized membrane protein
MNIAWYWYALILLFVGILEHTLSEYQNLVSVRLKVAQTILFAEVNLVIDFIVSIAWFFLLMDFWNQLEAGVFAWKKLVPYFVYIQGCVVGTGLAIFMYRKRKRKTDHEKRILQLEKARRIKKELQELKSQIITDVDEEMIFEDETHEETDNAKPEVDNKTNPNQTPPKK